MLMISALALFADAQGSDASTRGGDASSKEDLPKGIKESLAKQRIEREKKDYDEMVERSEEALKLTDQLEKSYAQNNKFTPDDQKKLDRLEKVVKKIRSEMGGDDDDDNDAPPSSISAALENLKTNTGKLADQIKNTSRYSISVAAVQSSNSLLKIVRFLRLRR